MKIFMGINKYYGGKYRYAKKIADFIEQHSNGHTTYIEPFCGWCSVMSEIVNRNIFELHEASDANESIVMFMNETSRGTFAPPEDISRGEYYDLKSQKTPSALQGFVGICYSFMGIWFHNYAADYAGTVFKKRDQYPQKITSRVCKLNDVNFRHAMYEDYAGREGCFFYLDPPYKTRSETYKFSNGEPIPFDTDKFWDFARRLSEKNTVIVSEYEAPDDFECVLEFKGYYRVEKVFQKIVSIKSVCD
jgi:DNA adenine methylase